MKTKYIVAVRLFERVELFEFKTSKEDFMHDLSQIDEKNYFRAWQSGERFVHFWSPDLFFRSEEEAVGFYESVKSEWCN